MPLFRETKHIFSEMGECFDSSWFNFNKTVYPETSEWDYKRELKIEDVEIWEVIKEWSCASVSSNGGHAGIYAAWRPHAELYMIKLPPELGGVVTFYGMNAEKECKKFLKSKSIQFFTYPKQYRSGVTVNRKGLHYHYKF